MNLTYLFVNLSLLLSAMAQIQGNLGRRKMSIKPNRHGRLEDGTRCTSGAVRLPTNLSTFLPLSLIALAMRIFGVPMLHQLDLLHMS